MSSPRSGITTEEDEDEEGEDLIGENMEADYKAIPALDRYESDDLTNEEVDELTYEQRAVAERAMRKRDLESTRRGGRLPAALLSPEDEEEPERPRRRRRIAENLANGLDEDGDDAALGDSSFVNLDDFKGPLREWIAMDAPRREIQRRFRQFLVTFVDAKGTCVYPQRISEMCADNRESLEVSYLNLSHAVPVLAIWVADAPMEMLEIFDETATNITLRMFPNYDKVHESIHVRITELPIVDSLRDLRQVHLNALIKVSGVVTRRTSVFPQLKLVKYDCVKCGEVMGPYVQKTSQEVKPGHCPECQSSGPFTVNLQQTIYRNYQKITLQESPGTVPAGRIPRRKEVILLHDLIDSARPGEEVEITGVYTNNFDASLNTKHGFPVFKTLIEANYVCKKQDLLSSFTLVDDDLKAIMELSRKPNVAEILVNSMCPSIHGHRDIKTAVALSLFGGCEKAHDKHRIRGDINVLLMGDPGTGKSQFLKYVEKTAHRAVYTTGKGASAVGLTASVRIDPLTREWTLEGGALVLADRGTCLIDEFDKMNDQDRTSIHEAMEQQSISISKAGIVSTLQARCAIIAAANPVKGRYDTSLTFEDNVDLTDAILSRFDIMCVVKDIVDPIKDEQLASFVLDSHIKSHPVNAEAGDDGQQQQQQQGAGGSGMQDVLSNAGARDGGGVGETISQDLLRKYILYAKRNCRPSLHNIDEDKISQVYSEMRLESAYSGGIPIAVRHVESLIRIAEAHAKMHLRDYVREDDVDMAIRVMLQSFIGAQKFSVKSSLQRRFQKYMVYKRDNFELLLHVLQVLVREQVHYRAPEADADARRKLLAMEPVEIEEGDFKAKAAEYNIHNMEPFYKSDLFHANRFAFDRERKVIVRRFGEESV